MNSGSVHGVDLIALLLASALTAQLGACSLSPVINSDVTDYQEAAAVAADRSLLRNILQAEDSEPQHFAELTQIRGAISTQLSLSTSFPFGLRRANATRDVATPSLLVSTSPTFDLTAADSQDFVRGITTPIDPRLITYLIDNGLDPRVALLLFFSAVELPSGEQISNNSDCGDLAQEDCRDSLISYAAYAAGIVGDLHARSFYGHHYTELRPIGRPFRLDVGANLKNLTDIDPSKFELRRIGNQTQLFSSSRHQKTVFCTEDTDHRSRVVGFANSNRPIFKGDYDRACSEREVTLDPDEKASGQTVLIVRSVYGIIQYLGGILRIQRQLGPGQCIEARPDATVSRLTTGPCSSGDVLFRAEPGVGQPLIEVNHRGQTFAVHRIAPGECIEDAAACDDSSQVLAVLTLLLDLNRKARDLFATPAVQGIP